MSHPTPNQIERACAGAWGITVKDLHRHSRSDRIAHARMLAMWLLIERLGWSNGRAGSYFGFAKWQGWYARHRVPEITEAWPLFSERRKVAERAL